MKRPSYENTHEEALSRLCFVCGEIIKETRRFDVDKNIELLRGGLNSPDFCPVPEVTPNHFCNKCHVIMRQNIGAGALKKTKQSSRQLIIWQKCGPDCSTCANITKRKQAGRGRHKKVIYSLIYF